MAQTLSFYKGNNFSEYRVGAIYFDDVEHLIKVGQGNSEYSVFSGVQSASWDNTEKKLSIVNEAGENILINLSNLASASGVEAAISEIWNTIGSEATGNNPATGLIKDIRDAQGDIDNLENVVGNADSGLVADLAAAEDRISAVEEEVLGADGEKGLSERVGDLEDAGYIVADDIPVTGVGASDKIISLDGKNITTSLSISYDSSNHEIKLLGKNSEQIGDAIDCSDFIADGILENAELVDLADDEVDGLDAGKYFKFTWNAAAGKDPVFIAMSEFAVSTYTGGNDISESNGEFSVSLDEDIEITGVKVGNLGVDITKLTAGMSLSEILTAMLCKDVDVKVNASPSLSAISGRPAAEYEVGSTVPSFTLSTSFSDGSFVSSDTSLYSASKFADSDHNGSSPLPAGCVVNTWSWNGSDSTSNTAEIASFDITSKKTYTVTANYSASTATPKTLLKNESAVSIPAGNATKSISIDVYYKDFMGAIPSSVSVTTAGLNSVDGISLSGAKHASGKKLVSASVGTKGIFIFTKSTVTKVTNKAETADFTSGLKVATVNYTNGETTTAYNLYSLVFPDGLEALNEYYVTIE